MINRWTRRQFVRRAFVLGVGLPSVFLAACGSKDSGTAVSTSAQSAAGSTAAATGAGSPTHTDMPGMSTTGSATPAASPISAAAPTASTTGNGTPEASSVASSGSTPLAPVEIKIVEPGIDYQTWTYKPNAVSVPVGTTVTWTNTGGAAHTVTADDGKSFDSGSVAPDKQFTLTMHTAGTFPYHCSFHPFMKATITVTA
jgi:plastocyanin